MLDRIADLRLREISVPVLEEFFEKLEEEGYSASYRRSVRTAIRGTLQIAVRYGLLDSNPVREPAGMRFDCSMSGCGPLRSAAAPWLANRRP
ncbi:hypothetical protein [Saccharopolyspora spinosa]|uniref:hypothetical protein n=1 Tax=Saccharopolyspora spinosa TaxID=60894 RepID=UPI000237A434|nr:hypothetical protein [Saccharopolyspora spinosa]